MLSFWPERICPLFQAIGSSAPVRSQLFRHADGLHRFFDIMGADNMGAIVDCDSSTGERADEAIRGLWLVENFANEGFP